MGDRGKKFRKQFNNVYVVRLEQTKSKIEIQQLKRKDIEIGILKIKKKGKKYFSLRKKGEDDNCMGVNIFVCF